MGKTFAEKMASLHGYTWPPVAEDQAKTDRIFAWWKTVVRMIPVAEVQASGQCWRGDESAVSELEVVTNTSNLEELEEMLEGLDENHWALLGKCNALGIENFYGVVNDHFVWRGGTIAR